MIIIEGPDCSGKSTLINQLKNELKWDAKSLHHKESNQFSRYLNEYAGNDLIVFDRSHFSEIVYSILWRGGNPFSKEEQKILDSFCIEKVLIIFACPSAKVLKKRYSERDYDQQIKYGELEKSRKLFCEVLKDIPKIVYESKNYEELDKLVKKIKMVVSR